MTFDGESSEKVLIFPEKQTANIWYQEIQSLIKIIDKKLNPMNRKLTLG